MAESLKLQIHPSTGLLRMAASVLSVWLTASPSLPAAGPVSLSRAEYVDRIEAIWTAQIAAVVMVWPHEHQVASVRWLTNYPRPYKTAPVDDDWYYEMCAVRAFEKYGIGLTAAQLGEQWLENQCGSWGSSEQALLNLKKGLKPPETGHPRRNKLWFTIGPQFSADVYGALAPGLVNLAGKLAREFGHVNGYAEGTDGAVFMAGMVSLAFVESDPREIVRKAARLLHPSSPYRQCLDQVIALAEAGKTFEEIARAVEDRWHIEYPATNNAVSNGGLVALAVWFGGADFLKTANLAAQAADFTDADCNAANAVAVVAAMHGMDAIPPHLVSQLGDRIVGEKMGPITLTPPVDESISALARRTAAIGKALLMTNGVKFENDAFVIAPQEPSTQPAELFRLSDLTSWWNPSWTLERAGCGGAGGGMGGIRGITYLDGEVLATYPRDEVRGCLLRRTVKLGESPRLTFEVGCDPGRAWELNVYADNTRLDKQILEGEGHARHWRTMEYDLKAFAGQEVTLRLYQRVLLHGKTAGNAYWRSVLVQ
jgi:hypothetical protein